MTQIFISYRRTELDLVRSIHDSLETLLNADVFWDMEIEEENWDTALTQKVVDSDLFLLVVSPTTFEPNRLDSDDWLRREVALALTANRHAVPILIEGIKLPHPDLIPSDMVGILRKQGIPVYRLQFEVGMRRLAKHCVDILPSKLTWRTEPTVDLSRFLPKPSSTKVNQVSVQGDRPVVITDSGLRDIHIQQGASKEQQVIWERQTLLQEIDAKQKQADDVQRKLNQLSIVTDRRNGFIGTLDLIVILFVVGFSISTGSSLLGILSIVGVVAYYYYRYTERQGQQSRQDERIQNEAKQLKLIKDDIARLKYELTNLQRGKS